MSDKKSMKEVEKYRQTIKSTFNSSHKLEEIMIKQ